MVAWDGGPWYDGIVSWEGGLAEVGIMACDGGWRWSGMEEVKGPLSVVCLCVSAVRVVYFRKLDSPCNRSLWG